MNSASPDLTDNILGNPIAFFTGCMVWIPLSIWILALLRWMIGGEIDVLFGIAGIAVAVGLGYISIVPPTPQFNYITFCATAGTVIMFPFVRYALNQRELKAVDVDDLIRAHEALRVRPDNQAAKFKIARLIFDMGYPGHALRIAEQCLQTTPTAFFEEERRLVRRWGNTPMAPKAFEPLPCNECGHPNELGNVHCAACGAPFILNRIKGKIMPSRLGRKLLAAWIVMVAAIAVVPFLASLGGVASLLGIFGVMILAVGILVLAFLPADKGVAV